MKISHNNNAASLNAQSKAGSTPRPSAAKEQSLDDIKDTFVEFGTGATPLLGALANGSGAFLSGLGQLFGDKSEEKNVAIAASGALSNVAGTTALGLGLAIGSGPVAVAGIGLLALSGLAHHALFQ